MRTWAQIRRTFDLFRSRYYLDAEEPQRVPPPSADLQWRWLADRALLGATHFDEDGDPHLIEIRFGMAPANTRAVIMHELSHMRLGPRASCRKRGRIWKAETLRLAQLGAFAREELF